MEADPIGPPRWVLAFFVIATLVVVAIAVFVGWRAETGFNAARDNTRILRVVEQSEKQRKCDAEALSKVVGTAMHRIADNFATAPYPDPARKKAVDDLNALGSGLDHPHPIPCAAVK